MNSWFSRLTLISYFEDKFCNYIFICILNWLLIKINSNSNEENMFYLMSLGIDKKTAKNMMLIGFIAPFSNKLSLEYSVELNKLLELEIDEED